MRWKATGFDSVLIDHDGACPTGSAAAPVLGSRQMQTIPKEIQSGFIRHH